MYEQLTDWLTGVDEHDRLANVLRNLLITDREEPAVKDDPELEPRILWKTEQSCSTTERMTWDRTWITLVEGDQRDQIGLLATF